MTHSSVTENHARTAEMLTFYSHLDVCPFAGSGAIPLSFQLIRMADSFFP